MLCFIFFKIVYKDDFIGIPKNTFLANFCPSVVLGDFRLVLTTTQIVYWTTGAVCPIVAYRHIRLNSLGLRWNSWKQCFETSARFYFLRKCSNYHAKSLFRCKYSCKILRKCCVKSHLFHVLWNHSLSRPPETSASLVYALICLRSLNQLQIIIFERHSP